VNVRDELRALLLLRLLPGLGDRGLVGLLRRHGSARASLQLPSRVFRVEAGHEAEGARRSPEIADQVEQIFEVCADLGIRILPIGDTGYPASLLALTDPPPVLFVRGRHPLDGDRSVAIVGSRRSTPVGRRTAERIAGQLSGYGVTVVSGMALGIDGAAHRGALGRPGSTIAVLGSGPDRAYPAGNRGIFERILEEGAVVSEFPPGEKPRPYHFPRRNRIIAALSKAVVVVEAAARSGALITVDHALDLGLDVFAVPGSVETLQARGTNALLRDGAHLLTTGDELMEVMGWRPFRGSVEDEGTSVDSPAGIAVTSGTITTASAGPGLATGAEQGAIESVLGDGAQPLDLLVDALQLPPRRVIAALARMELQGVVRQEGGAWWLEEGGRR
jgi:DNA processing protein